MASNDYHVIVYKLLTYLYECLKRDLDPDRAHIQEILDISGAKSEYADYIIGHMYSDGLIQGVDLVPIQRKKYPGIKYLQDFAITPLGIEYLQSNSMMARAMAFLKDAKDIIPWSYFM